MYLTVLRLKLYTVTGVNREGWVEYKNTYTNFIIRLKIIGDFVSLCVGIFFRNSHVNYIFVLSLFTPVGGTMYYIYATVSGTLWQTYSQLHQKYMYSYIQEILIFEQYCAFDKVYGHYFWFTIQGHGTLRPVRATLRSLSETTIYATFESDAVCHDLQIQSIQTTQRQVNKSLGISFVFINFCFHTHVYEKNCILLLLILIVS